MPGSPIASPQTAVPASSVTHAATANDFIRVRFEDAAARTEGRTSVVLLLAEEQRACAAANTSCFSWLGAWVSLIMAR
ncbi:hypothetical protein C1876_16610 [Eggerthella sinensis]|uniref:Uncharacterized protein n=1 Tax=Eggerthella sinensis TaxID=242230 RepID=A0A3N0IUL2_9ACTN|nr:hypothetical protein C1876_16610 [Eggerthella sinensis]RNM40587.1 hypothetical protein DMP09_13585 [Eggerthella sinensis]